MVKHAFRMGKVAEVYPFPQQHYLSSLSKAWMATATSLSVAESGLTGNANSITRQSNSEWHDAMRHFCSSLGGTTERGKSREGYEWKHDSSTSQTATHPVMTVLFDTAQKASDLLYEFAEAAVYLNREVWDVYIEAVRDAIPRVEANLKDGVGIWTTSRVASKAWSTRSFRNSTRGSGGAGTGLRDAGPGGVQGLAGLAGRTSSSRSACVTSRRTGRPRPGRTASRTPAPRHPFRTISGRRN
ncbi:hypothetical protein ACFZCL_02165 [Streptomyces sp. NPDC008159]|uniref:hypothetical protein n=1 Tax=Streptomyces sp. NPDC008159 TaxID=3364817 RepID=UPI0036E4280B